MILMRHCQSEFNAHFEVSREDPGIEDPRLTALGEQQAEAAAEILAQSGRVKRIVSSPYWRAMHTAEIVARRLDLEVVGVEPLVREHAFFACDIGSPRSELAARWPHYDYRDLPEEWWPPGGETEADLQARRDRYHQDLTKAGDWVGMLVISHWGFIRALTGEAVTNGALLHFDPLSLHARPLDEA